MEYNDCKFPLALEEASKKRLLLQQATTGPAASMNEIETYVDALYEEMDDKIKATSMILQVRVSTKGGHNSKRQVEHRFCLTTKFAKNMYSYIPRHHTKSKYS